MHKDKTNGDHHDTFETYLHRFNSRIQTNENAYEPILPETTHFS